jgi:hypothetical protein
MRYSYYNKSKLRAGCARGRQKKKTGDPVVGGYPGWGGGGGSKYEKGLGSDLFFRYLFTLFLNSPHRETPQKRDENKVEKKSVLDFWSSFL